MSNRDNFQWRPNDNSVTTNLRYDLEAEKWTKAFKSASMSTTSIGSAFGVIGLILSFAVNSLLLIFLCIAEVVKWAIKIRSNAIEKKQLEIQQQKRMQLAKDIKKEALKKNLLKLNLPTVNTKQRDPLFMKTAQFVVQEKEISITMLMLELQCDFERVCKLIDDLRLAGIISKYNSKYKGNRKVLISDEETLNLLFEIENEDALEN